METTPPALLPARSRFVTVLAWTFIVLTGFATLLSILQNVMIAMILSVDEMQFAMRAAPDRGEVAFYYRFIMEHIQLIFAAILLLTASFFTTSVALLKRKSWARVAFMGFMGLGITWNIICLILQACMIPALLPSEASTAFETQIKTMISTILIISSIMVIGMSVLFGWIIKRLASAPIKAEFQQAVP